MPTRIVSKDGGELLPNADGSVNVRSFPGTSTINAGFLSHTATTAAATLLTVAAGKTWVGEVGVSVAGQKAAAATGNGSVRGVVATAGTGVTPAAGTILAVECQPAANAAAGTTGSQDSSANRMRVVVNAPSGNSVTLTLASTVANVTTGVVDAYAIGESLS